MSLSSRGLDKILREWGHNILLQRRKNDNSFENTLERHTVRHMKPTVRLGVIQQEHVEGVTHDVDMVYYFRANARPREGDRIYEEDGRYPNGQSTWIIDYALPMRGRGGKIEFYAAGATREEPN